MLVREHEAIHFYSLIRETRFGHNMSSYAYFSSLLLATSWPKLKIDCKIQTFSLRFSC